MACHCSPTSEQLLDRHYKMLTTYTYIFLQPSPYDKNAFMLEKSYHKPEFKPWALQWQASVLIFSHQSALKMFKKPEVEGGNKTRWRCLKQAQVKQNYPTESVTELRSYWRLSMPSKCSTTYSQPWYDKHKGNPCNPHYNKNRKFIPL